MNDTNIDLTTDNSSAVQTNVQYNGLQEPNSYYLSIYSQTWFETAVSVTYRTSPQFSECTKIDFRNVNKYSRVT